MDEETCIVGAGPYGLSVAAHLRASGHSFRVFGTPLESWRKFMPRGMVLKSERFASNLWDPQRRFTLRRYCEDHGQPYQPVGNPLPLSVFLTYSEWFRQRAAIDVQETQVVSIRKIDQGFSLVLADGSSLTSHRVILATGHMDFRVLPPEITHVAEPRVLHSTRLAPIDTYAGRDVTIIGRGQSALETAVLLHEAGATVRIIIRGQFVSWNSPSKPRSFFKRLLRPDAGIAPGWRPFAVSEFPRLFHWYFPAEKRHRYVSRSFGASGSWWLRDRMDHRIDLLLSSRVEHADTAGDGVCLQVRGPAGVSEIFTNHLIAATGFRVDIDRLAFLDPSLRQDIARESEGIPALNSRFETSVPGLFIIGLASSPSFGPIMRFMYGAKHAAPVLARHLRSSEWRLRKNQRRPRQRALSVQPRAQ